MRQCRNLVRWLHYVAMAPRVPTIAPPHASNSLREALVGTRVTAPTTFLQTVPTSGEPTDVARAQSGDTRAFERLYRSHVSRILALVRRMLGTDYAHEVTQDVFVRAWEKIGTFRGEAAFGTWLHRVAISVVLHRRNALRLERSRIQDDEDAIEAAPARPSTADLGMDFERAIVKLPAGARTVFVLHDVEGFKHEEIAAMLGVTSGTTKAQLHRARMILRQHLDR
jgi:RNA polymerase sigma-70 factor, ECF subfamily